MAHTNAWGSKFDLGGKKVKRQHRTIILAIFVDLLSPIIVQRLGPRAYLVLEKKSFEGFTYMGMAAILINGPQPFQQSFVLLPKEAPHEI